ncbi:transcriptional regulator domain-containing protein [uncultured Roseibium sp.]|uniref:transcriptional regulator domain-containing protein n=1 Tax=uncultured Roseibium sp. TaxID=1936171 RepID=UPI003749BA9C
MVAQAKWRDDEAYRYLEDLNPAELAWEFLRRNSDYQREVAASSPLDDRAVAALNAHWGLRFPRYLRTYPPRVPTSSGAPQSIRPQSFWHR